MSAFASEVGGIQKRHGILIEEALIFAINKLPSWMARREKIPVPGGKRHLDCLAYNSTSGLLYVFECKRGHGRFDSDKVRSIDDRLRTVSGAIGPHVAALGWTPRSTHTYLLSFYGQKWQSAFPIYDRTNISKLFEPCVERLVGEYMIHVENTTARAYRDDFSAADSTPHDPQRSIFDELEAWSDREPTVVFTGDEVYFER